MSELPRATVEKILKKNGAKRVANPAVKKFIEVLEEISSNIAAEAISLAHHAGRKTVTAADIKLANKRTTK